MLNTLVFFRKIFISDKIILKYFCTDAIAMSYTKNEHYNLVISLISPEIVKPVNNLSKVCCDINLYFSL